MTWVGCSGGSEEEGRIRVTPAQVVGGYELKLDQLCLRIPQRTTNEARERDLPTPSRLPAFPSSLPSVGPLPAASMAHLGSFFPLHTSTVREIDSITILRQISRLQLTLIPTHPDRAAGLNFLATPQKHFGILACGSRRDTASHHGTKRLPRIHTTSLPQAQRTGR
jgi:hypothetical protein